MGLPEGGFRHKNCAEVRFVAMFLRCGLGKTALEEERRQWNEHLPFLATFSEQTLQPESKACVRVDRSCQECGLCECVPRITVGIAIDELWSGSVPSHPQANVISKQVPKYQSISGVQILKILKYFVIIC